MVSSGSNPSNKYRPVVLYLMRLQSIKKGSFERFLIELAEKCGEEFKFVFAFQKSPPDWLRDNLRDRGAEVDSAEVTTSLSGFWEIDRLIRKYRPKIVHLHFFGLLSPVYLYLRWRHRIMVVAHVHSVNSYKVGRTRLATWLIPLRKRLAVKSIHKAICVSEFVRERTNSEFPFRECQVVTVYNGIDPYLYQFEGSGALRGTLGIPSDSRIIFSAAWLNEIKGMHVLVQALQQVFGSVGGEKLFAVIAGEGPQRSELEEMARQLKIERKVFFLGWRDDVPDLIKDADIIVVPSVCEEACSYFVLEAMAAGKPIVASNTGGIPEMLGGNPPAGLFVAVGDAYVLGRGILALLERQDMRYSFSSAVKIKCSTSFSLSKQVENITLAYENLIVQA